MIYSTAIESPMGRLMLAGDEDSLIGLWLNGQKYSDTKKNAEWPERGDTKVFAMTAKWLTAYFAGQKPGLAALPLAPQGGEFRRAVWDALCAIPYGGLTTYGDVAMLVAEKLGRDRMSAQAVGGAVGANPISIIIPCHRVVGKSGSLTGYGGGLDKKIKLLEHEGADISTLFMPKSKK